MPTPAYNCIAWAAGSNNRWWWPNEHAFWPPTAPRQETLEAFRAVFMLFGYTVCELEDFEEGWEKIAIFVDDSGTPTHAARQLEDGLWTSKCGSAEDIKHELHDLEEHEGEGGYGHVACIMRRRAESHSYRAA
jgi:hypothetical protein